MKLTLSLALASLMILSSASFASAIDQRQKNQSKRIYQGVANGSLTHKEATRLTKQQHRIASLKRPSKSTTLLAK